MARKVKKSRETGETQIVVEVNLDGTGESSIETQVPFFTHILHMISKHAKINLKVEATGDLDHHVIEDAAIVLGQAIKEALGDKKGIYRFGNHFVAMDESLARCVIDVSGRSYYVGDLKLVGLDIEKMKAEDIDHFLITLTQNLKANLHLHVLYGANDHHKVEAAMKALALALRQAIAIDSVGKDTIPSTKGSL